MTTGGERLERWIHRGLGLAFVVALTAALTWRTRHLSPDVPRLTLHPHPLAASVRFGRIETLEQAGKAVELTVRPVRLRPLEPVLVKGWVVDPVSGGPPEHVLAQIGDAPPATGPVDTWRPDVAASLNDPFASLSGYRVTVLPGPPGRHRLRISIDSRGRSVSAAELDVEVGP